MEMTKPLITVITVVYNDVSNIEQTILSVINQIYPNLEYIIIDGGSTDGTVDVIKKYVNRLAYWISEPDKGIYDAMNKGVRKAKGKWVNFMNSGDLFASNDAVERIFNAKINDDIKVIYGSVFLKKNGKRILQKPFPICRISNHMSFCHQASFTRTDSVHFDLTYKIVADYKLFYDLYNSFGKTAFLCNENIVVAIYECENGVSSKQGRICFYENLMVSSKAKNLRWYYNYVKAHINDLLKRW